MRRKLASILAAAGLGLSLTPLIGVGTAYAAPPGGHFLNPDATDGPGNVVSDTPDGQDGTYHIVFRATPNDAGQTVTSVVLQIEDGDADVAFEPLGNATQVGGTDTWEYRFDVSAWPAPADVNNDAGIIRAIVTDSGGETVNVDVAVNLQNTTAHTLELTEPDTAEQYGFFDPDGAGALFPRAAVTGTTSNSAIGLPVDVFYTKSAVGVADPVWIRCADGVIATSSNAGDPTANGVFEATCTTVSNADAGVTITGIAARIDVAPSNNAVPTAVESGDAHRVEGYNQSLAGATLQLTPSPSTTETVGFCANFRAQVIDSTSGNPIVGVDLGMKATGPDDSLQFARSLDEAPVGENFPTGDVIDDALVVPAPAGGVLQATALCDSAGEPDGQVEDNDSDAGPAAQANFVLPGADDKIGEGVTDADGFEFSLDSEAVGSTALRVFIDTNGNDLEDGGETVATSSVTWGAVNVAAGLDATPDRDVNRAGQAHTFNCRVVDGNGNPVQGETCRFNVASGPDADDDNDANGFTPVGYLGSCATAANGSCAITFTGAQQGSEIGKDLVDVFLNRGVESGTDPSFRADDDDIKDRVEKTYGAVAPAQACIDVEPNTADNATTSPHPITIYVTNGTAYTTVSGDRPGVNDCNGAPLADVVVDVSIVDDDPNVELTPQNDDDTGKNVETARDDTIVVTNAQGVATATLTNPNPAATGTNTVRADIQATAEFPAANGELITKNWAVAGSGFNIDCSPEDDYNLPGQRHDLTAKVTDVNGAAVSGANVDFVVVAGPNAARDLDGNPATALGYIGEGTTNATGDVGPIGYIGVAGGTVATSNDVIDCFIDVGDNDVDDGEVVEADSVADANTYIDAEDLTPPPNGTGADQGDRSDFVDKFWKPASQDPATVNVEIDAEPGVGPSGASTSGGGLDRGTPPGFRNDETCNATVGVAPATFTAASFQATDTVGTNSVRRICVSAEDVGGNELVGATVTLASESQTGGAGTITDRDGPPPSLTTQTAVIETNGFATFYVFSDKAGAQKLTASITSPTGVTDTDTATITWVAPAAEARNIVCEPVNPTVGIGASGGSVEITCTITDGLGPVAGVTPTFVKTDSEGAQSAFDSIQGASDINGKSRVTLRSPTTGKTQLKAQLNPAASECEQPAGQPDTINTNPFVGSDGGTNWDANKPAGNCETTVNITWSTQQGNNTPPPPPGGDNTSTLPGYTLVAADGGIFNFGTAFFGSLGGLRLNAPIVGMAYTNTGKGYWLVASDGGIFAFGDALFRGSTGSIKLARPIVGMSASPSGLGYWLVASDGGIFAFGDAKFFGSTGAIRLNQPIVGMTATPSGLGYWLVATDGGIFAFGNAKFFGSLGSVKLNQPIVGIARTLSGQGYYMVASDGGIFAFGDAVFRGSTGSIRLNSPVVGIILAPTGDGYWLIARDGGVFAFNAPFRGSTGSLKLVSPVLGGATPPPGNVGSSSWGR